MEIKRIAEICHETNRIYCESINDHSILEWNHTPQEIKDSTINGVENMVKYPGLTPEQSHKNWMKFKASQGWKYGETKDYEKKMHPCMIEYSQLPVEQRNKDLIFKTICNLFSGL